MDDDLPPGKVLDHPGGMMAIRKGVEESLMVAGSPATWFDKCERALASKKFKKVRTRAEIGQVSADYKPWIGTLHGEILLTLSREGPDTRIHVRATAAIDNAYALVRSPGARLIEMFKQGLLAQGVTPRAAPGAPAPRRAAEPTPQDATGSSVSEELARLAALHQKGLIDDAEFKAAKAKILG